MSAAPQPGSGHEPAGGVFWAMVVLGGAVLGYGVLGLLRSARGTVPPAWAGWLLAALLVHDLALVPLVFAVGRAIRRAPEPVRPQVRAALTISGVLLLVTLPLLIGGGRATQPGNTSLLPSNYVLNLTLVLTVVWTVAGVSALARALRAQRRPSPDADST